MRILVTGGAGFIGSVLLNTLSKRKDVELQIFDNFTHGFTKDGFTIKNIVSPIVGSVHNYYDLYNTLQRFQPDVILHMASYEVRPESVGDVRKCAEVNYLGTANLIQACFNLKKKPLKVIFTSSEAANNPVSHYGVSKRGAEDLLLNLLPKIGIDVAILRLSEVYGYSPSMTSLALPNFLVDHMFLGNNIRLFGVEKLRNFIHVSDAVKIIVQSFSEHIKTGIWDVRSELNTSPQDLVRLLKKYIPYKGQFDFSENSLIPVCASNSTVINNVKLLEENTQILLEDGLLELCKKRKKEII